jgi:hypothetical protein
VAKATGLARPSRDQIDGLIRTQKANVTRFKDDGVIRNHAHWPLIFYRGPISLPGNLDPAAIMADLFEENSWGRFVAQRNLRLRPLPFTHSRGAWHR